jgi:hypothetical protein
MSMQYYECTMKVCQIYNIGWSVTCWPEDDMIQIERIQKKTWIQNILWKGQEVPYIIFMNFTLQNRFETLYCTFAGFEKWLLHKSNTIMWYSFFSYLFIVEAFHYNIDIIIIIVQIHQDTYCIILQVSTSTILGQATQI